MIHIMYGLPASGKTTLAMKLYELLCAEATGYNKDKITYLNVDEQDYKCISNTTGYGIGYSRHDVIIVDGYFKTVKDIATKFWNKGKWFIDYDPSEICIHVFEQNKQACFENDKLRNRDSLAFNSINEGIEDFSISKFKESFFKDRECYFYNSEISILQEKVISYSEKRSETIYSSWLVGDDCTEEFKELDTYLEKKYPTLTFLQYKKICKHTKIEEMFTRDYYDKHDTRSIQYSIKVDDIEKEIQ